MADTVHVNKLNEGARAWNAWRAGQPLLVPDLRYVVIEEGKARFGPVDGEPINLRGALMFKASLRGASLIQADLSAAELVEADLAEARLDDADLRHANLTDAFLRGADFSGAKLNGADLSGADLAGARNLTQEQIDSAQGDPTTHLPPHVKAPALWSRPKPAAGGRRPSVADSEPIIVIGKGDDLYAILGVSPKETDANIHAIYRVRAKALHPDLNPGDEEAEAAFRRLTFAYAILRDPARRARYDRGEIGPDGEETEHYIYREWRAARLRRMRFYAVVSFVAALLIGGLAATQLPRLAPEFAARIGIAPKPTPMAGAGEHKSRPTAAPALEGRAKGQSRMEEKREERARSDRDKGALERARPLPGPHLRPMAPFIYNSTAPFRATAFNPLAPPGPAGQSSPWPQHPCSPYASSSPESAFIDAVRRAEHGCARQ